MDTSWPLCRTCWLLCVRWRQLKIYSFLKCLLRELDPVRGCIVVLGLPPVDRKLASSAVDGLPQVPMPGPAAGALVPLGPLAPAAAMPLRRSVPFGRGEGVRLAPSGRLRAISRLRDPPDA